MRIYSAALMMTLGACGSAPTVASKVDAANANDRIECAVRDGNMTRNCAIEDAGANAFTLHHDDGGFRRMTRDDDGRISTADGAEAVMIQMLDDGHSEILVGEGRYRLPAGR